MDRNSLRTSVVVEVANQEEPEDQKTYQIDFDELDIPKDYVIDQVFCGENITVYALLEVPEEANLTSKDQLLKVSNSKTTDSFRYFQGSSSKKIMNQRRLNGLRQNIMNSEESSLNILTNTDTSNGSYYCLKHLGGDYDMLTPESENSDLKVLYSKGTVSRPTRSTKFKAVSKGVNTDIVQSPKIINEVQKAIKQNISPSITSGVKSISSSKPSYEVIEMEMRPSFSSISSYGDRRKESKNSVPNFFLVPLLMMDDGVLSHFQSDDKIPKLVEEKKLKTEVVSEKVTTGTNTDLSVSEDEKNESTTDVSPSECSKFGRDGKQRQINSSSHGKLSSKTTILSEIKKLQGKLNALIKSIETDAFELDTSELDSIVEEPQPEKVDSTATSMSELKPNRPSWNKFDELPILSSLSYPPRKTERKKLVEFPNNMPNEKQNEKQNEIHNEIHNEIPNEIHNQIHNEIPNEEPTLEPTKSVSIGFISVEGSSKSQTTRTHSLLNYEDNNSKEELTKIESNCSIIWSELDNKRGAGLSKSTTNNHLNLVDPKFNLINGIKKSFSFDLRDVKLEVTCLKKIKNNSFKLDNKPNIRIPQIGEAIMKCEMGDEAFNKPKPSKIDLLTLSKNLEKLEDLKLEQKNLDPKKVEEGDAKLVYSKQNLLSHMISRRVEDVEVHFCNTMNTIPRENLLTPEKSILQSPIKSKGVCSVDPEKVSNELEKPVTPNRSIRKSTPSNTKREAKTIKKVNIPQFKAKTPEKLPKSDAKSEGSQQESGLKQRSVTGSRKFTLKGSAESKLHVDRLMKPENSTIPKPEKAGAKVSRLPCHKKEPVEPSVNREESKEKVEKMPRTSSPFFRKEAKEDSDFVMSLERIGEDSAEGSDENSPAVPPSSSVVVVELLSEKPSATLCPEEAQKCTSLIETPDGDMVFEGSPKLLDETSDGSLVLEKPVVKSVWALTKVLLFEDGSKKLEILEASLTPPGYTLPNLRPNDDINPLN